MIIINKVRNKDKLQALVTMQTTRRSSGKNNQKTKNGKKNNSTDILSKKQTKSPTRKFELRKRNLKREIEFLLIAVQNNVLKTMSKKE